MPYPALPEDQMDERTRQANALRRENLKDFGKDLWTNANGLADVVNSMVLNAGGQVLSGWEGYGDYFQHADVDRMANIIEARNKSNEELFRPGERGQQYMQSLGEGLNAAKIAALRVPGVAKAAELAQRGWEGLTNASPMLGASIVGAANVIDPTHGRAGRIARTAEEAAEMAAKAAVRQTPEEIASQIPRNLKLSPEDQLIEQNFARQIANDPDAAFAWYSQHPETMGGKVIAPDIMREYSEDYVRDRSKSAAVHEPSSWASKRAYEKLLESPPGPGEDNLVMFNAGGTGAGKTTGLALRGEDTARAKAIYDTNMANFKSADEKIQQALNAGNDVTLQYTYRDPVEALVNGALKRAKRQERELGTGRTVPLDEHVKTHVNSSRTIKQLAEKYAGDDRVHITVIDNSRGPGNAAVGDIDTIPEMDYDQVLEGARNALEASYQNGDISEAIYRGFKEGQSEGPATRGALEANRAGNGQPAQSAGQGRKVAIGNLWDEVTDPQQALAMALRGEHLKTTPAGDIVGAPEGVRTPADLAALRANADAKVQAGASGMDWYDRARREAQELAPDDPAAQSLFARGTAAYSPQSTPPTEIGAFAKQHNAKVLTGEDVRPRTASQMEAVAKGYGEEGFTPENIKLGKKTGPYAEAKDPTVDPSTLYKTANDIWHGRVMGYGENFDRGFTPQEHGFLTGENLLLADRARLADEAAGITRPTEWSPRSAQAATWTAQRKQQYLAEALKRGEADTPELRAAIEKRATAGIPEAVDQNLAYIMKEERPGSMTGEDPRAGDYGNSRAAIPNRDPIINALRMYQRDTVPTEGFYTNSQGVVERNPAGATPVLVGKNRNLETGIPSTPAAEMAALEQAAHQHAFTRAQDSVGITRFHPESDQAAKDLNALLLERGDPDQIARMERAAQELGASPIDTGNRTMLTMFGNEGPKAGTTKAMVDALRRHGVEGNAVRGTLEANLVESKMPAQQGTGVATQHLLDESARREQLIPGLEARTAQASAQDAAAVAALREAAAQATGGTLRADLTRALKILSEGGLPALRAHVAKFGTAGLPAVVLAILAGREGGGQPQPGA